MNERYDAPSIHRIAALIEHFDRCCEQSAAQLRQVTQQVPRVLRKSAEDELKRLPGEVMRSVHQTVTDYERRLEDTVQRLQKTVGVLTTQLERAEKASQRNVWKGTVVTWATLVVLLAGGGYLLTGYRAEINRSQITADLLRAYNQADVTLCDGRLCAKVEWKDKRFGEYVPVKRR